VCVCNMCVYVCERDMSEVGNERQSEIACACVCSWTYLDQFESIDKQTNRGLQTWHGGCQNFLHVILGQMHLCIFTDDTCMHRHVLFL